LVFYSARGQPSGDIGADRGPITDRTHAFGLFLR
jgi:hypothetical protein